MLGPLYNKSFDQKIRALDEALSALNERVSSLRDRSMVRTGERVETVETVVHKMNRTGEVTLERVHSLQSEVRVLGDSADRTNLQISSMNEDMKTFSDVQQAKADAQRALQIAVTNQTRTAECKSDCTTPEDLRSCIYSHQGWKRRTESSTG